MKIALSSGGKDLKSTLDSRFGRCTYFLVHNTDTNDLKVLDNKGKSAGGGAGISAAQQLIDEEIDAVITKNMGPNAYNLMKDSNIKVYRGDNIPCELLIKRFEENKLEEITEAGPAHHGGA
ncbi:NifB/NifX family molybdenum-iron cluster-binding protein [Clostridiisalibacter paucivorans]|uniref:NifB/NifX family molybdenum-iron cluster-binding protein n=1 Tax=Clostridiisalibacter paucivorans TaxID=408753 RepID=UPI00047BFC6A|nr:NifB/NifX family molybdenum-iron cluster-binding protein [Clostridiisalibacter paucivorans]